MCKPHLYFAFTLKRYKTKKHITKQKLIKSKNDYKKNYKNKKSTVKTLKIQKNKKYKSCNCLIIQINSNTTIKTHT